MMKSNSRVLVLLAHPNLSRSRINLRLRNSINNIADITVHDLYDAYPDFYIDTNHEQGLLLQHDLIVFQHPLYWYSTPPLLKLWQDVVLCAGFAYGEKGNALQGKDLLQVVSTGGKAQSFQADGYNKFTIKALLAPMIATANMCGLRYLNPLVFHHSFDATDEMISAHACSYQTMLMNYKPSDVEAMNSTGKIDGK